MSKHYDGADGNTVNEWACGQWPDCMCQNRVCREDASNITAPELPRRNPDEFDIEPRPDRCHHTHPCPFPDCCPDGCRSFAEPEPEVESCQCSGVLDSDGYCYRYGLKHEPRADCQPEANPKDLQGDKKAALRHVPPALSILGSDAFAQGADKYGSFNWRDKPIKMMTYLEALDRHKAALQDGQDIDPESGKHHLSHMIACLGILADAIALGNIVDDRPLPGPAAELLEERDRR